MPIAKRSIEGRVTIDETDLLWRVHREQSSAGEGEPLGLAIHVKVASGTRKALHLEYQPVRVEKPGKLWTPPPRPTIVAAKVAAHIREALEHGWDPESRGKPFFFYPDELPS